MENKALYDLLKSMNISGDEDVYDINDALRGMGISRDNIRVHSGASKVCLDFIRENFVIKWTYAGGRYDTDEALAEVQIYEEAVRQGIQFFFPVTEVFATINGINFIWQEKIDFSVSHVSPATEKKYVHQSRTASDRICNKMQKCFDKAGDGSYARQLNKTWAKMALVLYGKKAVKHLCGFVVEHGINDLHESNLGYKNDRPIILDFSGYNR